MPNIGIVWDFDGTLSPHDSTTKVVETIIGEKGGEFWQYIKSLRRDKNLKPENWEHILASDAPIWMYSLSRIAAARRIPLNSEFFKTFVLPKLELYPNTIAFLSELKRLEKLKSFRDVGLEIHHFVVSAGLKDLIQQVFPSKLMTWVFGCRYEVIVAEGHQDEPESIPVFCMDETMKTRSLFEISKGSFRDKNRGVNIKVDEGKLWAPFKNIIYVGDGFTDVPALSLTRSMGGTGIVVFNAENPKEEDMRKLRLDRRADLITPANFSIEGELFKYIKARCIQIKQRYRAEMVL